MFFHINDEVAYQGLQPARRLKYSIRADANFGVLHTTLIARVIDTEYSQLIPLRPRRMVAEIIAPDGLSVVYDNGQVKFSTTQGLALEGTTKGWEVARLFVFDSPLGQDLDHVISFVQPTP